MTEFELHEIEKRVDEINEILDLCLPGWDDDVLENLDAELASIEAVLEKSEHEALNRERRKV